MAVAWKNDDVWKNVVKGATADEEYEWLKEVFGKRFSSPDLPFIKITEVVTGYFYVIIHSSEKHSCPGRDGDDLRSVLPNQVITESSSRGPRWPALAI